MPFARSLRIPLWLALIAAAALQPASGAKPAPDLSGSWVRDPGASDDPVAKVKENAQARPPRARPPFGIGFPGGVWFPGSGRPPTRGGGGGGGPQGGPTTGRSAGGGSGGRAGAVGRGAALGQKEA
jgi:hypothetical protein